MLTKSGVNCDLFPLLINWLRLLPLVAVCKDLRSSLSLMLTKSQVEISILDGPSGRLNMILVFPHNFKFAKISMFVKRVLAKKVSTTSYLNSANAPQADAKPISPILTFLSMLHFKSLLT